MRFLRIAALVLCMIAAFSLIVHAQADCPTIVSAALDTANRQCSITGPNQACYGNILLDAQPQPGITDLNFSQPGDTAAVNSIKTLRLSALDQATSEWGVAVMHIQANLPDTLPGQNVTLLLFGDVSVTNAVSNEAAPTIEATAAANVNIRALPSTSAAVLSSLASGKTVTLDGSLADHSWLHVQQSDDAASGWVLASLMNTKGSPATLDFLNPAAPTITYGPMQAFYFQTGLGDRPCAEAPDSGVLVQTPEGAGSVELRANEVDITLDATAYLQAGNGYMTVSVVEGTATLETHGVHQLVPAGTYSRIPLDSNGAASGSPEYPQPYDYEALKTLPVQIVLPQTITLAPPLAEKDIAAAISAPDAQVDGQASNGKWANTNTVIENTCDPNKLPPGFVSTATASVTFSPDRSSLLFDWGNGEIYTFTLTGDTTYLVHRNPSETWTITFTSATTYVTALRGDYGTCLYSHTGTGAYVG